MADFDFLEGFDMDGDWGFTSVKEKPSEEQSKQTETVVKQTAEGTAKAVSSLSLIHISEPTRPY